MLPTVLDRRCRVNVSGVVTPSRSAWRCCSSDIPRRRREAGHARAVLHKNGYIHLAAHARDRVDVFANG